jgi:carotenoid isomerooxygenase
MGKNLIRSIFINQDQPIECKITGIVPEWLNGTLFRNGPGRFRFGEKVYNHFFDGMATINKFQIINGKVFFTNKVLETNTLKYNLKEDRLAATFGTIGKHGKYWVNY